MTYLINDIWYTLQGEGYWTGRPAVFVRFSRCNLWTGREEDRHKAICQFCDTDFAKGLRYSFKHLQLRIGATWPDGCDNPMVVFTGGEPALQLDETMVDTLSMAGWYTAIETNGTIPLPRNWLNWICVSPKAGADLKQTTGNELKIVWPQPFDLDHIWRETNFDHYWLSPMDGPDLADNTRKVVDYVMANPHWRLNIQTHKVIGVR